MLFVSLGFVYCFIIIIIIIIIIKFIIITLLLLILLLLLLLFLLLSLLLLSSVFRIALLKAVWTFLLLQWFFSDTGRKLNVQDVFWTSYVRTIYILYRLGCAGMYVILYFCLLVYCDCKFYVTVLLLTLFVHFIRSTFMFVNKIELLNIES